LSTLFVRVWLCAKAGEKHRVPGVVCRASHPGGLFFGFLCPFLGFVSFGRAKEMNPQCGRGSPHQNKTIATAIQNRYKPTPKRL